MEEMNQRIRWVGGVGKREKGKASDAVLPVLVQFWLFPLILLRTFTPLAVFGGREGTVILVVHLDHHPIRLDWPAGRHIEKRFGFSSTLHFDRVALGGKVCERPQWKTSNITSSS